MNKAIHLLLLLLLLNLGALSAQNLVLNGDFEQQNVCAEYNEHCAPVAWRSTSEKLFGYNEKSDKNRFATLTLFSSGRAEDRKFIQTELLCPFEEGETYKISFWVEGNIYSIHSICVGFSEQFQFYDSWLDFADIDKECVATKSLIQNGEWVKVELVYQAQGDEKFIIIGNLNRDAETAYTISDKKAYKKIRKSYTRQAHIQYKIDNVFVKSLNSELCEDYKLRAKHVATQHHRHKRDYTAYSKPENEILPIAFAQEAEVIEVQKKEIVEAVVPEPKNRKIVLKDVFFDPNKSTLDLSNQLQLKNLILEMNSHKNMRILIIGHTDQMGTAEFNMDLSIRRAKAVKSYLAQQGIASGRMRTAGKGESELLSEQMDKESLSMNRRVEIEVLEN